MYKYYEKFLARSNQPGQLHETAKMHKFEKTEDIKFEELKFCLIIALAGTYTYNITAKYPTLLCVRNIYLTSNTQEFAK